MESDSLWVKCVVIILYGNQASMFSQQTDLQKHLDPQQISIRAKIIQQEISDPSQCGYLENKELTELDRSLISSSRALMVASKNAVDQMTKGLFLIWGARQYEP